MPLTHSMFPFVAFFFTVNSLVSHIQNATNETIEKKKKKKKILKSHVRLISPLRQRQLIEPFLITSFSVIVHEMRACLHRSNKKKQKKELHVKCHERDRLYPFENRHLEKSKIPTIFVLSRTRTKSMGRKNRYHYSPIYNTRRNVNSFRIAFPGVLRTMLRASMSLIQAKTNETNKRKKKTKSETHNRWVYLVWRLHYSLSPFSSNDCFGKMVRLCLHNTNYRLCQIRILFRHFSSVFVVARVVVVVR